jgi:hypothetical protein
MMSVNGVQNGHRCCARQWADVTAALMNVRVRGPNIEYQEQLKTENGWIS